jgi:cystathionine beta-lyase
MISADIERLIRRNTKVVYLEAPGSQTFEVQDVDAIAGVAKSRRRRAGRQYLGDAALFQAVRPRLRPLHPAGTKYIVGPPTP